MKCYSKSESLHLTMITLVICFEIRFVYKNLPKFYNFLKKKIIKNPVHGNTLSLYPSKTPLHKEKTKLISFLKLTKMSYFINYLVFS